MLHDNAAVTLPALARAFLRSALWFGALTTTVCTAALADAPLLHLVGPDDALPVIVAADAPGATREAALDLVRTLEHITGQRPELHAAVPGPLPAQAIWVGMQPALTQVMPNADLSLTQPEEILIVNDGRHLAILGRDRVVDGQQTEYGTANAVSTFLQRHLDVRWLWPGELGTDIIQRESIQLAPFTHRFHPPLRERVFRFPRNRTDRAAILWWDRFQRARGSLESDGAHAFEHWWDRFGESNPEWFALQPDGSRTPPAQPGRVKLCVSNPGVAAQWLDDAERTLRADPRRRAIGASPNDGGGWCGCENCRAWDHPDAPAGVLTERYVRFWNLLAQGLTERFPDREIILDVMAYSRYRRPPEETALAPSIAISYVGHFPITSEAEREREKQEWLAWAPLSTMIKYRPNVFWYSGGVWGFPSLETRKTIEDFRFIAENSGVGVDFDSVHLNYATQGPQLYLMAQLAYDPLQDGAALLADYYRRGFGPAAANIESYFTLMEQAHQQVVETSGFRTSSGARFQVLETLKAVYNDALFAQAEAALHSAETAVSDATESYRQRVAFVRTGLTFTQLQVHILHAMDRVRETQGLDDAALQAAIALCAARDQLFAAAEPFALDAQRITDQIQRRGLRDHLGPPSEAFLTAATRHAAEREDRRTAPRTLAPVDAWLPVIEDRFERESLGDEWETPAGVWTIEDGQLVTTSRGAILLTAADIPGLQRIVFDIMAPTPAGHDFLQKEGGAPVSDLSPLLHADATDRPTRTGYFLQFGGGNNTHNTLLRRGSSVTQHADAAIVPDRMHRMIAEFDGTHVRLTVDDEIVLEYPEPDPLIGAGHGRAGIHLWTGARIDRIAVYRAEPRDAHPDLDDPDFE